MRDYWVLARDKDGPDIELIRDGFSWGACLIPLIWALYRRLWWIALGLLVLWIAQGLLLAELRIDSTGMTIISVAEAVILGWFGGELRRWEMGRKGFRLVDLVTARRFDDAEVLAVSRLADAAMELEAPDLAIHRSEFV